MLRKNFNFAINSKNLSFLNLSIRKYVSEPSLNCWSCDRKLSKKEACAFFCPCPSKKILPVSKSVNYFNLFNLNQIYKIDKSNLTKEFRKLMKTLHPDLYTLKTKEEKEFSSNHSSQLNKAYSVLSSPIDRGLYLLELKNVDYEKVANMIKQHDSDKQKIIMDIIELNELVDEVQSLEELTKLELRLDKIMEPFEKHLEIAFNTNNIDEAIKVISKMKYYQNIDERLKELKLKFDLNDKELI